MRVYFLNPITAGEIARFLTNGTATVSQIQ